MDPLICYLYVNTNDDVFLRHILKRLTVYYEKCPDIAVIPWRSPPLLTTRDNLTEEQAMLAMMGTQRLQACLDLQDAIQAQATCIIVAGPCYAPVMPLATNPRIQLGAYLCNTILLPAHHGMTISIQEGQPMDTVILPQIHQCIFGQ